MKTKDIAIVFSLTGLLILFSCYQSHECSKKEYQIEIDQNEVRVYDGKRLVGKYAPDFDNPSPIDSIFLKDNL